MGHHCATRLAVAIGLAMLPVTGGTAQSCCSQADLALVTFAGGRGSTEWRGAPTAPGSSPDRPIAGSSCGT